MIHDAKVEVTCDTDHCRESVLVDLPFTYGGIMHAEGHYDHNAGRIECILIKEHAWKILDGKHYCESCAHSLGAP